MQSEVTNGEFSWSEVERLLDEFKRVARRALSRERLADLQTTDLMQTALRRMFQSDDGWDYEHVWANRAHALAWFRTVVLRALKDHRRARTAQFRTAPGKVLSLEELLEAPQGPAPRDPELMHDLAQAIEELAARDPGAAELIALSHLVGFSAAEIAEFQGVSERHVRRLLAAALQKFLGRLDPGS